jgi:hypothetical protein
MPAKNGTPTRTETVQRQTTNRFGLTSVLLREDASALLDRVCSDSQTSNTRAGAVIWLQREARYLRRIANLLDTNVGRLTLELAQCEDGEQPSQTMQS